MSELVKPEIPGGFKDYLPKEQIPRIKILRIIEEVYQLFGFLPLDTPEVEKWSVLTGNQPTDMRIYRVGLSGEAMDAKESLALRFDLTVPLARVVAAYGKDLVKPFKRYQLGRVFRGESSQRGRFNGFYQFDIDIVYSSSMLADAEIIAIIWTTLQALEIHNILIRVNNRKILNGLAEVVGINHKATAFFQVLDKLESIGIDGVITELARKPDNEFDETALALNHDQISQVEEFLVLSGSSEPLIAVEKFFNTRTAVGTEGVVEMYQVVRLTNELNVPQEKIKVDLSVARGLSYYTGPVFETTLLDLPDIGSIFSGGRFDGLVGRFSRTSVPATGASIGVDRLFEALRELGLLSKFASGITKVLVSVFDPKYTTEYLRTTTELRESGIETEIYLGNERSLKAQIAYALKQDIPFLVIAGPDEFQNKVWQVKNLRTRQQVTVPWSDVVDYIKQVL